MRNRTLPDRGFQIRTPRLLLRATTVDDAPRLAEILSNWNVTRMLRMALWPVTERAIERWVEDHQGEWDSGSAYRFAVERQGVVVGQIDVDDIEGDAGDLGYWFDEAAWGQGFAGEAAAAATHFALNTLQLTGLYAGHSADNPASGKVLRRLGFEFVEDTAKYSRPEGRDMPWRMYRMIRPST